MIFPEIKKTVKSFLLGEEGKISKQSVLKIGIFVVGSLGFSAMSAKPACADHLNCGPCNRYTPQHLNLHKDDGWPCDHSNDQRNEVCGDDVHNNSISVSPTASRIDATHAHFIDRAANHCNDHGSDHTWC